MERQYGKIARDGGLDELYELALREPITGYQWLLVALDFGHEAAGDTLSDVNEHCDEFRYNDEHAIPQAHLEASRSYLHGTDGLAQDFERATEHLDEFLLYTFGSVESAESVRTDTIASLEEHLSPELRVQLREFVADLPFRRVSWLVNRLQRLRSLGAPQVVVMHVFESLEQAVAALAPLVSAS